MAIRNYYHFLLSIYIIKKNFILENVDVSITEFKRIVSELLKRCISILSIIILSFLKMVLQKYVNMYIYDLAFVILG
jgi:hypothetical protein